MNKAELIKKAKKLGIQGNVNVMKEETLQRKINEKLNENPSNTNEKTVLTVREKEVSDEDILLGNAENKTEVLTVIDVFNKKRIYTVKNNKENNKPTYFNGKYIESFFTQENKREFERLENGEKMVIVGDYTIEYIKTEG